MGRRRRRIIKKKIVKPPPKIFTCPLCNVEAVTVHRLKDEEYAEVICTSCKARVKVRWHQAFSDVDAYTEFYDIVTGAKKVEAVVESGEQEKATEVYEHDLLNVEKGEEKVVEETSSEEAREVE
ncbi:MAG: hypothetical protein NZ929_05030 [Aigarchaeota archaeon]|nr:hypothetical protein [Aigarchaeota archaeon]MCX8192676.1 hypothetical protein [Nitrososphaeria archaeon]MDW7985635.1 hypothetical protein [Nitrososphaerota archaeon]